MSKAIDVRKLEPDYVVAKNHVRWLGLSTNACTLINENTFGAQPIFELRRIMREIMESWVYV